MELQKRNQRRGTVAAFLCFMMLPLLGLLALSVDYGFLLYVRTDMQRVADQAVIAGVRDLTPDAFGNQDFEKVRATVRQYVALNLGDEFVVQDSDIEIGRFNPDTIYGSLELLNNGIRDTVRVQIRRDDLANNSVSLYFARVFGKDDSNVDAYSTAILRRARFLGPGTSVLPIAIEQKSWNHMAQGETASIYGDGRIEDANGNTIPGNWGTVDIGPNSNSSSALSEQIRNGLTQNDLDSLHSQGAISDPAYLDGAIQIDLNGDTGLSSGLKHAVQDEHGTMKVAPIYKKTKGHGGNLVFEIVGWATVEVVDSGWNGSQNSYIEVRKSYTYDGHLLPVNDLSDTTNIIEGAYTSPVLAQ